MSQSRRVMTDFSTGLIAGLIIGATAALATVVLLVWTLLGPIL